MLRTWQVFVNVTHWPDLPCSPALTCTLIVHAMFINLVLTRWGRKPTPSVMLFTDALSGYGISGWACPRRRWPRFSHLLVPLRWCWLSIIGPDAAGLRNTDPTAIPSSAGHLLMPLVKGDPQPRPDSCAKPVGAGFGSRDVNEYGTVWPGMAAG